MQVQNPLQNGEHYTAVSISVTIIQSITFLSRLLKRREKIYHGSSLRIAPTMTIAVI